MFVIYNCIYSSYNFMFEDMSVWIMGICLLFYILLSFFVNVIICNFCIFNIGPVIHQTVNNLYSF